MPTFGGARSRVRGMGHSAPDVLDGVALTASYRSVTDVGGAVSRVKRSPVSRVHSCRLRERVLIFFCVGRVQGDSAEDMDQEASEDDTGRRSARTRRKSVVDSPSAEEKALDEDQDSSDGDDVQPVSFHSAVFTKLEIRC